MPSRRAVRSTFRAALVAALASTVWGCAELRPPPAPRLGFRFGPSDASCASEISRAHAALADAGAAAGDPTGTATALATHASAMASYHTCLADRARR